MQAAGKIISRKDNKILIEAVLPDCEYDPLNDVNIEYSDGRTITPSQRRKIWAIINEIAFNYGYYSTELAELNYIFKIMYCNQNNLFEMFSTSKCSMQTARDYISFLIDFCLKEGIQTVDTLLNLTDDVSAYLYSCLMRKKCCVCGKKADVHHIDKVGMGRDRKTLNHLGLSCEALCRKHHNEAHLKGQSTFDEDYHTYGIKLDEKLCKQLKLHYRGCDVGDL